jgi:hypothetical protein
MDLTSSISEEHAQYAIQPYYNIGIIPFLRSDSDRCIFEAIYSLKFVVPVNTVKRSSGYRPASPGVGYIVYRGHLFNSLLI